MLHLIVGHFGSGKTEIALNEALHMAGWQGSNDLDTLTMQHQPLPQSSAMPMSVLVDLDIINPMFRSTRAAPLLAANGVRLVHSPFALSSVDMPVVTREVAGALQSPLPVVVDVGGDDIGAVVLGQFAAQIQTIGYKMSYVINARRPFSGDAAQVTAMLQRIQQVSRLEVRELYNNTHMMEETTLEELLDGQALCESVADTFEVPVTRAYACRQALLDAAGAHEVFARFVAQGGMFMQLQRLLRLPW